MRPLARLGFAIVIAGATALVSGCDSLDTLTLFDSKTKLSGDRKPVFPEGVPGVTPGVPPEMVKGYHEPVAETSPPAVPGEQPKPEAKPKSAEAKPTPKPHAVQAAAKPKPAPAVQAQASPPPAPGTTATAPWPNQPQQPQQPQPQAQAPWPSAPASGTVSR
jgi:hypothetical protein